MDLTRLREGRVGRTRTWASVCVGLFGDDAADRPSGDEDADGN